MEVKRMEIFLVRLDGAIGREQGKIRPAVVVSNDIGNQYSDIVTIVPITSTTRLLPTHVWIEKSKKNGLSNDSMALAEQMRTVDKCRIIKKLGRASKETEKQLNDAIKVALCA